MILPLNGRCYSVDVIYFASVSADVHSQRALNFVQEFQSAENWSRDSFAFENSTKTWLV